jgi:hypothetical protein
VQIKRKFRGPDVRTIQAAQLLSGAVRLDGEDGESWLVSVRVLDFDGYNCFYKRGPMFVRLRDMVGEVREATIEQNEDKTTTFVFSSLHAMKFKMPPPYSMDLPPGRRLLSPPGNHPNVFLPFTPWVRANALYHLRLVKVGDQYKVVALDGSSWPVQLGDVHEGLQRYALL